jgi:CubicO group peptidase (beta-lactamase class C family)
VDDQRVLWATGVGFADVARQTPAGPDTLYRMGSVSKLLTATAAMQGVAQGRLSLDVPVQQVLPWFRIGSAWPPAPITLRDLLTHRAGLPRDRLAGMWLQQAPAPKHDFRAALRSLGDEQLRVPPGQIVSYSNLGLDLAGLMVEAVAGEAFEDHLRKHLLEPLGMRDSSFAAMPPESAAMAVGHFKSVPQQEPALRNVPAGALTASVNDMARFLMMQFAEGRNGAGETVLPRAQQAEMLRVQNAGAALDADLHVGLGWMFTTFGTDTVHGGGPVAHHAGATLYHRSMLMMLPEQKLGVVVVSNDGAATEAVNRIAQRALALLLEARTGQRQPPAKPGFVPARQALNAEDKSALQRDCVGDYLTTAGLLRVRSQGDWVTARLGERSVDLLPGEGGRFGLRYRWLGLVPIPLGPLSLMGFECRQTAGRTLIFATLDGQRLMVGDRLQPAPPAWPGYTSRWLGRYEAIWQPGEVPSVGREVRLLQADGRLWVEFSTHPAFGGGRMRILMQPESETTALLPGPLADSGARLRVNSKPGEPARVHYSGWEFVRVGD